MENDEHYLTEHQDLYEYAKTEEVTEKIETAKDEIYSTVEEEYAKKAEIPSKVSELENDKGYLTEHQSLEEYAKKSEIPNVPTKVSELENDKGYLTEHQSLKDYATLEYVQTIDNFKYDGINYNKATKRIDLYVGDKIRGGVDVTDFVKDGMLDNVKLVDNNLVFSFNKDAEKEDIVITLPKDFIPSDYYTKTDVDDKLSVKADKSEIPTVPTKVSELENDVPYLTEHQSLEGYALKTELPTKTSQLTNDSGYITSASIPSDYAKKTDIPTKVSQLANDSGYLTEHQDISGKVDVTTFNEYKQSAGSEIENKQEVLVSGTNIKTINGQSILGSGNITIEGGSTLTIDTEMSDTSTNAVQNKVIKSYVDSQTVNIPTKTSQLVNDSGYITSASISTDYAKKTDLPTKTSQLTNDSGYITSASLSTDFAKVTYVDTQDSTTLKTANSYTDTSITNLTWKGTQAQYDALTTIDDKVIYFIKES